MELTMLLRSRADGRFKPEGAESESENAET